MGKLICPASLLGRLDPRHIEARDEWVLDVAEDPLVEWWLSKLDDKLLYPGRFYYVPFTLAGSVFIEKDEEFLSTAERLFKWVRKETRAVETEWGRERLGSVAAEKLQNGEISLRQNPPGSRI